MQLYDIRPAPTAASASARITHLPILLLNIHSQCNCRCVMCDIWQRKESRELTPAQLAPHRESMQSLGVRHVVLSGGEPLLNRHLKAICQFFRDLQIRVTLLTTGLLLHTKAELVVDGVDDIILSMDGPAPVHNAIRRIPRAFETIARGVERVHRMSLKIPIACRTTVQKLNHTQLRGAVDAAHELGLSRISFLPADLSSTAFNREQPWAPSRKNEISLTAPELIALEEEIEALILTHKQDLRTHYIVEDEAKLRRVADRFREHLDGSGGKAPACNAPWISSVMEVDGTLRPCFFHPVIGQMESATLEEAVNSNTALSFRSGLDVASDPVCRRCVCSLNYRDSPSRQPPLYLTGSTPP